MEGGDPRQSDRIYLELPIVLEGTDAVGRRFAEEALTLVVSRRGARIVSQQNLVPQQILIIRCLKTGLESEARVVGPIEGEKEGCHFGISLMHPEVNLWGIDFPEITPADTPAGRVYLECTRCRSPEVVHLDVFELEVLLANEGLVRPCSECSASTLWTRPPRAGESPPRNETRRARTESARSILPPEVPASPPLRESVQKRRDPRVNLEVDACIRHRVLGDETVITENVSRGGFRFRSRRDYSVDMLIEAALPYVPGAANIFTPARIVYKEGPGPDGTIAYGVAYIPAKMAKSLTGMRISRPTEQ